jgi:hypothetical protein
LAPSLNPTSEQTKVRLELRNLGIIRPGMFAAATFMDLPELEKAGE